MGVCTLIATGTLLVLLGGSWVISGVISPLIWVISYKYRYPTSNSSL